MTTAVSDNPTTKTKSTINISPEAKRASALRRDASMLERLAAGSSDPSVMLAQAAQYKAQADALSPAKAGSGPVATLTEAEWTVIEGLALNDLRGFLRKGFSVKKLKTIAAGE